MVPFTRTTGYGELMNASISGLFRTAISWNDRGVLMEHLIV